MLSIKDAAHRARQYLVELFGEVADIRLEEVESEENNWLITLSFLANAPQEDAWIMTQSKMIRQYKIFTIDRDTGEVLAMRIRTLHV
ncbi:MAG TPA: hypothetical protein VM008_14655 [Phycisphaerae bacterium]|nr:hypothetical protein [Phycisphaerae bacterium]